MRFPAWLVVLLIHVHASSAFAAGDPGLVAQWNFDESGEVAKDSSGNRHDGKISGAVRVPQGGGSALSLDGLDDYVDCGALGISGPISVELWIKPTRKAHGLAVVMGEELSSYLLTYYNTEVCDFFVGGGGNNSRGVLQLNEWNHVAASFDGEKITQWVNGRQTFSYESKFKTYKTVGQFVIGTKGQPSLPRFKGLLDSVRVYNRPLSGDEVTARFKAEAGQHDFDPAAFTHAKTDLYEYLDGDDPYVVVVADFKQLLPLRGNGRLEATLANRTKPGEVIQKFVSDPVPNHDRYGGVVEALLSCKGIETGNYVVRVALRDAEGEYPVEERAFSYRKATPSLPMPSEHAVPALTKPRTPERFAFNMLTGGGFEVTLNGVTYPFVTRISWPNGDFNRMVPAKQPWQQGEKNWRVQSKPTGQGRWIVEAAGSDFYTVRRDLQVFPTHISVKDTYTNLTKDALGLLIYNETPIKSESITRSFLSGYDRWGRQTEMSYPDYGPSTFFTDAKNGIGVIPIDDVYVVQGLPYVAWQDAAGVATEKFALAPGASYTLEWAVYPTGSKDYYDFINTFRKVENRIGTVPGAPGYLTNTLHSPERRNVPDLDYIRKRNLKIGLIHNLAETADDPKLSVEGIEYTDFPKEMALLREQREKLRAIDPALKVMFHIAHSLYCTNQPERFADSKVIGSDGKQLTWDDGASFGSEHQAQGWRWWIFYPTPGNSFHKALIDSVDVLMDKLGMNGAFMDGFLAGYCGHWSYDTDVRWDGHSAEINASTKTITRKMNSVILLSQPSMIEYARKIRDKGGVVIAMHTVLTRSITKENYIIFSNECASGPELHLAPNSAVLGSNQGFRSESAIYRDTLDKLSWGEAYLRYLDGRPLTHESLSSWQFPLTCEEIRPGLIKGSQRIVTMNSGVFGWPEKRELHLVRKFDGRGAPTGHDFITTVDSGSVRTELTLKEHESAVIESMPATIEIASPVNVRVTRLDPDEIRILVSGNGKGRLRLQSGVFEVNEKSTFLAGPSGAMARVTPNKQELVTPFELKGSLELVVRRAAEAK